MAYYRREPPKNPAELPDFLRQEFQRLQQELSSAQELLRLAEQNTTPDKPRKGDVRLADGTNWDPLSDATQQPVWYDGSAWRGFWDAGGPYDIGGYLAGVPTASQIIQRHVFTRGAVFPASLSGSQANAATAATAQTDFDVQKNGVSIGTMRFAAAGTTATFISASGGTFAAGDLMSVVAPGTPDATLATISWTFKGART